VHAFCRRRRRLPDAYKTLCTSVVKGDARSEEDLDRALEKTRADVVMVVVGEGDAGTDTDLRTANAKALSRVLVDRPHVRVVALSSFGAGKSRIIVRLGIGALVTRKLRRILKDHSGQEAAFLSTMPERTLIVRATAFIDGFPVGKIALFGDKEKAPTIYIDREDAADYMVDNALDVYGNNSMIITSSTTTTTTTTTTTKNGTKSIIEEKQHYNYIGGGRCVNITAVHHTLNA